MKECYFCGDMVFRLQTKDPPSCKKCYRKYINPQKDRREEPVQVTCEYEVSPKCVKTHTISKRAEQQNRKRNSGSYICFYCSRTLTHSGRNNPNCIYNFDDRFFENIDSPEKAYILGIIASDGYVNKSSIRISLMKYDYQILVKVLNVICPEKTTKLIEDQVYISFDSKQMSKDICRHLSISPGKKSDCVNFPSNSISDELMVHFIRGFFDGDGWVSNIRKNKKSYPTCGIGGNSKNMIFSIYEFMNISGTRSQDGSGSFYIEYSNNNALDFMGKIYEDLSSGLFLRRKLELFEDWCAWVPSLSGSGMWGNNPYFKWSKTRKDAVSPQKSRISDSGFDITLLEKIKTFGEVGFYTTGIKIQPSFGWYFDLVPRSSIVKSGYMLANGVGVIDRTYIGPILVPLIKVDKSQKDIELPCKLVQLIPRPIIHIEPVYVDNECDLDSTQRGEGGFGSTGK